MTARPRSVELEPGVFSLHATDHALREEADTSYEHRERQHILSRDWAAVHVSADRRRRFASVLGWFR